MSKTYKLNLFHDERDIWTESSLSPFVNIEPMYVMTEDENFIENIYAMIVDYLLNEYNYILRYDELTFHYYDGHYLNENSRDVIFNRFEKDKMIEFLCEHANLCSFQVNDGKYWSLLYMSIQETNMKGAIYSDAEILSYVREKIDN